MKTAVRKDGCFFYCLLENGKGFDISQWACYTRSSEKERRDRFLEFEQILAAHRERYPLMQPRDYGKLAYQSEFGAEHLISDETAVFERLLEEWNSVPVGTEYRAAEDIGGGLCRFYLNDTDDKKLAADVLVKLFLLTAKERRGSGEGLEKKLSELEKLPVPGMKE